MKAFVNLLVAAVLVAGLAGCAATTTATPAKVKCPACNYEFVPPAVGP